MKRPDFFIVGAPKCGTTAMYKYLKQHPEIFMPERKEIHFFGTDLKSKYFLREKDIYLSLFSKAKDEKRIGECSVWYLYSKKAAEEIKEFYPSARIIIMLRNPVDMLYSQHSQFIYNGNEDIVDFEDALNAEDDRKRGLRIPKSVHFVESLFYRETAKFSQQVKRYLNIYEKENIHIIIYDDLKRDTEEVYKKTLHFLDVNEGFLPELKIINPNKRARTKILRKLYSDQPLLTKSVGKILIPSAFRTKLLRALKKINTKYLPRPPMDAELRKKLQAEFAPEVENLSKLLGRDLTHWVLT